MLVWIHSITHVHNHLCVELTLAACSGLSRRRRVRYSFAWVMSVVSSLSTLIHDCRLGATLALDYNDDYLLLVLCDSFQWSGAHACYLGLLYMRRYVVLSSIPLVLMFHSWCFAVQLLTASVYSTCCTCWRRRCVVACPTRCSCRVFNAVRLNPRQLAS
jgi:hypothetical protein